MMPPPSRPSVSPTSGCSVLVGGIEDRLRVLGSRLPDLSLQFCTADAGYAEQVSLLKEADFGVFVHSAPIHDAAIGALTAALEKAAGPELHVLLLVDQPENLKPWRERLDFLGNRLLVVAEPLHELELIQLLNLLSAKRRLEQAATLVSGGRNPPPAESAPYIDAAQEFILVVDDDETITQIMSQVLVAHQHATITAHNADEAWRLWRRHLDRICLVITDINMPGGANGVELARAIQQDRPNIPVIYTSGQRATAAHSTLKAGVNYLPKPFGMNDLLHVVQLNLGADKPQ